MERRAVEFEWDEINRGHLARHRVAPREAESAVLDNNAVLLELQFEAGEERTKALGMTASGRILAVVFTLRGDVIRPIRIYRATAATEIVYRPERRMIEKGKMPKF
ncbi:MAG TPA: BrnT family toxin [Bryobacteraceae bacterium]|nr:BrnT family toxin [Bryobacteraceae bacterium]